jgi:O-antigen ligase
MNSSTLSPSTTPQSLRARIPLVSTSFANNLWYYALLWPVWWALGIEQILLPFFALYELVRFLIRADWQVRLNSTGVIALLLALWWLVPVFWVDREFLDIYLKETAAIWSQAIFLILIYNEIRTGREWRTLVRVLTIMAVYTALAGVIYLAGVWRGGFTSVFGAFLPQSLVNNSAFFSSIAIRQFGSPAGEVGLLPIRLRGFSLSYSSLSMICLLLIPFIYWRMTQSRGVGRLLMAGLAFILFVCLLFTESRISYLAFAAAVPFFLVLRWGLLRGHNRPLTIALALAAMGAGILLVYIAQGLIFDTLQAAFIDLRPSSWIVRLNIYVVTLRLLPEHPIAGWGVPVRIPGASNVYSAGTHSSYLGMLFQHGIVGLVLYLGLWLSIWVVVIRGLRRPVDRSTSALWIALATAFFAFNIREVADSWWWDQSLTFVVWVMWGAAITAGRRFIGDEGETSA